MKERFEGSIYLGNTVDITDPSYEKSVFCRKTIECVPGKYDCYSLIEDYGDWGKRVSCARIMKSDVDPEEWVEEAFIIGVDAGLAGFFNDKPDFTDEEWFSLCDSLGEDDAWIRKFSNRDGFFTSSGFGDGGYPVNVAYSNGPGSPIVAAEIVFIGED